MNKGKKLNVSHAPFWHNNNEIPKRNYNTIIATLPAILIGFLYYGIPAIGVVCLSISSSIIWEIIFKRLTKQNITVGDGNAALTGTIISMILPASAPWWLVIVATFIAIIIGIQIFGGIGSNPFNPAALSIAILMISWKKFFDFDEALINFTLNYFPICKDPLSTLKYFGPQAINNFNLIDLLLGKHIGSIGSSCSLALLIGGIYLIIKKVIRWEISFSFILSVFITATIFNCINPCKYANGEFHLLTGFTIIGAFFIATESSSSPVNFFAMFIYGTLAGTMTVLIRNIGLYTDGVIFAILIANLANPIIDKIRPTAIGKVV